MTSLSCKLRLVSELRKIEKALRYAVRNMKAEVK